MLKIFTSDIIEDENTEQGCKTFVLTLDKFLYRIITKNITRRRSGLIILLFLKPFL